MLLFALSASCLPLMRVPACVSGDESGLAREEHAPRRGGHGGGARAAGQRGVREGPHGAVRFPARSPLGLTRCRSCGSSRVSERHLDSQGSVYTYVRTCLGAPRPFSTLLARRLLPKPSPTSWEGTPCHTNGSRGRFEQALGALVGPMVQTLNGGQNIEVLSDTLDYVQAVIRQVRRAALA